MKIRSWWRRAAKEVLGTALKKAMKVERVRASVYCGHKPRSDRHHVPMAMRGRGKS